VLAHQELGRSCPNYKPEPDQGEQAQVGLPLLIALSEMRTPDYTALLRGRQVTALMPLRFASVHRFLAAREIRFLPSAERRPCADSGSLAGGFAALIAGTFTTPFARTTNDLPESSYSRKSRACAGHWSITFDRIASNLFNRF
jgi:hypothetical protein